MRSLIILYFSGTGNTKYVAERMYDGLDYEKKSVFSIEENVDFESILDEANDVMVMYPIYGGNIPIIMRDFLRRYRLSFMGKTLITVVTEAGFSGDGGALAYRYLDSDKVIYKASAHIIMPTNVSFGKLFCIKNGKALEPILKRANKRIDRVISRLNSGRRQMTGSSHLAYLIGYHLQRKYFDRIEDNLRHKFSVDTSKCVRCLRCIDICPMDNISLKNGAIVGSGKCTLCYRCLHACKVNAISIIRHEDVQYKGVNNGV